jgi:aryl-alcohol dehydrogenase-like predicted oxidoreductase
MNGNDRQTNQPTNSLTRRHFLKGAIAAPVGLALTSAAAVSPLDITVPDLPKVMPVPSEQPLPRRKLGRNGPEITMLCLGGQSEASCADFYDRAWSMGIRYFDVASNYRGGQSERDLAAWIQRRPERRSEVFITTKGEPKQLADIPKEVDKRLKAVGTSYLDLFLIHQIGAKEYGEQSYEWPKSPEFKKICEDLKASGKVKLMGYSCHDPFFDRYLHAAAEGGFVDAVLMPATPFLNKNEKNEKAIEAAHQAGIGLMCMKVMRNAKKMPQRIPEFDKLGLTTHQAALHAVWSDHRISGAVVWIANDTEMAINTEAARLYKHPLQAEHKELLKNLMLANDPVLCPGCPSCQTYAEAHPLNFNKICRFVAYYEQDGNLEVREHYQAMPAVEKDATGINLVAMRERCEYKINYPKIIEKAERYFA